jgi:hypothetical protein
MGRRRSRVLFSDDLLSLRIGNLGRIPPCSRRRCHVLTRDDSAAVDVTVDAREEEAELTLIYECTQTRVRLVSKVILGARHWYFLGSDGSRGVKLFWLPGVRWDTRTALGLKPRSMYIGATKRRKQTLARVTAQIEEIVRRSPIRQRQARLEESRAKLLYELGMTP